MSLDYYPPHTPLETVVSHANTAIERWDAGERNNAAKANLTRILNTCIVRGLDTFAAEIEKRVGIRRTK